MYKYKKKDINIKYNTIKIKQTKLALDIYKKIKLGSRTFRTRDK
jgi:hypothetical protein